MILMRLVPVLLGHPFPPKPTAMYFPPRLRPLFCSCVNVLHEVQRRRSYWVNEFDARCACSNDDAQVEQGDRGRLNGVQGTKAIFTKNIGCSEEMEKIGAILGEDSQEGDTILLSGDLGTGKTCFARGFIRARVGEPSLPVTSPSYLLDNTYKTEGGDLIIHHMDLYRLSGASDLHILDIPEVLQSSICLIEWPCRLGSLLPETRLDVNFVAVGEDKRNVTFTGYGEWWAGAVMDLRYKEDRNNFVEVCAQIPDW